MNNKALLHVAEQSYLPLSVPEVHGNQDYREFKVQIRGQELGVKYRVA